LDASEQKVRQLEEKLNQNNVILDWHKEELRKSGNKIEELQQLNETFGNASNYVSAANLPN
jgi:hypothetical protein